MLQIRPFINRAQQRFKSFGLAAKNAYNFTREKANSSLPLLSRLGSYLHGVNTRIQGSSDFTHGAKSTVGNLHNAVDNLVKNYTGAVHKWNRVHDIVAAPIAM